MRCLPAFLLAALMAAPACAQFAITVQQNGQAANAANGSSITLNAPIAGKTATATVTVTYLGNGTVTFRASQLLGSNNFTSTGATALTLSPLQSATFSLQYFASDASLASGQFFWPFNEVSATNPPVTTATGAVTFNLLGTAPNLIVGQINQSGSFQIVPAGGNIQFQDTLLNNLATITLAISNAGSGPGTLNSITTSGDAYQVRSVPLLPLTIGAGNQLNVTLQFQPTASGPAKGGLQIAFASGTYTATLSGNGISSFLSYKLIQDGTTSALLPGQTITLGDTKVGGMSSVVIQFQNTGTVPAVLNSVAISGPGFTFSDGPFLPLTLQPQQSNTVTINYMPTAPGPSSARLLIGGDSFQLAGRGLGPLVQFSYKSGAATVSVNPGETIPFAPLAASQTGTLQFTLTNAGTTAAPVTSIGVLDNSGVFRLANLPALPLQLAPSASITFTVMFSPAIAGASSTTLVINNQTFGLSGFSSAPPDLPTYHFTGASGTQQPFQQLSTGLTLDAPYPLPLSGILTLTIISNSFSTDPAVQFSSGGRQVAFTIPANSLSAVFPNGSTQVQLQTGTVAGSFQITPAFASGGANVTPANPVTVQLTVPSLAPQLLTAALGSRSATGFSVVLTGYSTNRFLDHLTFTLVPAAGFTLSGTNFPVDLSSASRVWFQSANSQNLGGQFIVEIPFTLSSSGTGTTGTVTTSTDLTKSLSAFTVTATNDVGSSNKLQVTLP